MKKWLVLLLALFMVGCSTKSFEKAVGKEITLVKAVDGDTAQFVIDGQKERVRFLLIDTPESVKENTPVQPFGKEASERVKALLSKAKRITIEYEQGMERDDYKRVLGYIFVDGELLEAILVREGLARVAYYKGHEKYLQHLKEVQEKAKSQKVGIWSISGYVTERGFKE